jgi:cytochrome P450
VAVEINHLYGAFNAIDYVSTCALCELAQDPQLTLGIRSELDLALDDGRVPSRDHLARMPLTNGFILEVLRRYPVSMSVHRQTGEPLELGGETLPAGTQVAILLHALHHHPDFWEQPESFTPSRWHGSSSPRVPYSYVPFLLGARKCMGRDMAEQQLLITLAAIVRPFNLAIHADPIVPPFMIPRFAGAIPFSLSPARA